MHIDYPNAGIPSTTSKIVHKNGTDFPGIRETIFSTQPQINFPEQIASMPIYRVLDHDGMILESSQEPKISREVVQKMYRNMVQLNVMDKILYESQRQGRISFYMTNYGIVSIE